MHPDFPPGSTAWPTRIPGTEVIVLWFGDIPRPGGAVDVSADLCQPLDRRVGLPASQLPKYERIEVATAQNCRHPAAFNGYNP